MQAARMLLLTLLCWTASAAAQEIPSATLVREVEMRRGGTLLPVQHAVEETRRAIAALRVYAGTRSEAYYGEALRRALHLAAFDPAETSAEDSRSIAWALALAYDWLSPRLDAASRDELLRALLARAAPLFDRPSPESIPVLTAIATLLSGELPEAQRWLQQLQLEREVS